MQKLLFLNSLLLITCLSPIGLSAQPKLNAAKVDMNVVCTLAWRYLWMYIIRKTQTAMVSFIKNYGLKVPYLMDKNQKVMNALGAKRCPESFLITPSNWKTVYHGAIDNNPQVAADVSEHYLTDALEEILRGGQVSTPFQRPSGCIIK